MLSFVVKNRNLHIIELFYIFIPLALFFMGWTKWYIGIICCLVGLFSIIKIIRTSDVEKCVRIHTPVFILGICSISFIAITCGLGRWTVQTMDYYKHNAILQDLIDRSWPVYYQNDNEHSMLTYYIAYYLFPALIGKITRSFRVAEIVMFVWSVLGLVLIWIHLMSHLNIKRIWDQVLCLIAMIFFSAPVLVGELVAVGMGVPVGDNFIESGWFVFMDDPRIHLQLTPNYMMLSFVFPQVIVCWMALMIFLERKDDIGVYVPILLPTFLYGAFSFVGLFFLAVAYACCELYRERKFKQWIKSVLSLCNVSYSLTIGTVMILYFWGNVFSDKPDFMNFQLATFVDNPLQFILFYLLVVLPYPLLFLKWCKKEPLFIISTVVLLILPLFHMGKANDLLMRVSIPCLFILMVLFLKIMTSGHDEERKTGRINYYLDCLQKDFFSCFIKLLLAISFIINIPLQIWLLSNNMQDLSFPEAAYLNTNISMEYEANRSYYRGEDGADVIFNYYTYDPDNCPFCRYIAREV